MAVIALPCIGTLPPPFLDLILSRRYAEGVFLNGCRQGDCHYRLGIDWTEQRIARTRDPYLRQRVPRERIVTCWLGPGRAEQCVHKLADFRARLKETASGRETDTPASVSEPVAG